MRTWPPSTAPWIPASQDTDVVDFVFWDGSQTWDNNERRDGAIALAPCALFPSDAAFQAWYEGDAVWAFAFSNSLPGYLYDLHYSTNLLQGV